VLDRPRHEKLIAELRAIGVRHHADRRRRCGRRDRDHQSRHHDRHLYGLGRRAGGRAGGAALRCVGGQFKGRLLFRNDDERARARKWGITDLDKQYDLTELAKGDCIFAATGVTDGSLLAGRQALKGKMTTESVVMRASSGTVRWVKGEHRTD
jgi:fructose-1,6-bisphosphatase II / sedoheptulose-1,7-bisphosphatase